MHGVKTLEIGTELLLLESHLCKVLRYVQNRISIVHNTSQSNLYVAVSQQKLIVHSWDINRNDLCFSGHMVLGPFLCLGHVC